MPGGNIQTVQKICVAEFVRSQIGQIYDFIHLRAIIRLTLQNSQRLIDPVQ